MKTQILLIAAVASTAGAFSVPVSNTLAMMDVILGSILSYMVGNFSGEQGTRGCLIFPTMSNHINQSHDMIVGVRTPHG